MKLFWQGKILEVAESDIFCVTFYTKYVTFSHFRSRFSKWSFPAIKYLSRYNHFLVLKLSSKMCSRKLILRHILEGRFGPTTSARSLKPTWYKVRNQTV